MEIGLNFLISVVETQIVSIISGGSSYEGMYYRVFLEIFVKNFQNLEKRNRV